eukprot:jgi/Astpho2/6143/fgenesh1_pg.00086_%23_2_t
MLKQAEERTLQAEHFAQERVRRMAVQNVEVVRANGRQQEVIRELKRHTEQLRLENTCLRGSAKAKAGEDAEVIRRLQRQIGRLQQQLRAFSKQAHRARGRRAESGVLIKAGHPGRQREASHRPAAEASTDEAQPHSDEESATSSEAAAVSVEARGSSDLETAPAEPQTAVTTAAPAAGPPGSETAPGLQCFPLVSQVAQQQDILETAPSSLLWEAAKQAAEDDEAGPTSVGRDDAVCCPAAHASLPQLLAEDSPASSVSAMPAASEAQQEAATSGSALQKLWDSLDRAGSFTTLAPPLDSAPEIRPVQAPLPPLASALRVRLPVKESEDEIGISLSQAAARAAAAISRATSRAIYPSELMDAEAAGRGESACAAVDLSRKDDGSADSYQTPRSVAPEPDGEDRAAASALRRTSARSKPSVCYEEPCLRRKLRQGDPNTFLDLIGAKKPAVQQK